MVLSFFGQSRACCLVAAYLMRRFRWCLDKALEFVSFRRPGHQLQQSFLEQLADYEQRLRDRSPQQPWTTSWKKDCLDMEESMLTNTFLNSQKATAEELSSLRDRPIRKTPKLKWLDGNPSILAQNDRNPSGADPRLEKPAGADRHNAEKCPKDKQGKLILKSALKSSLSKKSASDPDLHSNQKMLPRALAPLQHRPKSSPPVPSRAAAPGAAPKEKHTKVRAKVYRFLLRFAPPALGVEWSSSLSDNSLSQSLYGASGSLGDGQRKCSHIEFSLNDLMDATDLADRVVRDHDFLSSRHLPRIERLLRQLASQVRQYIEWWRRRLPCKMP